MTARAEAIAAKIEAFIRTEVIPYEKDPRTGPHGPSDELVQELRDKARKAGVLTPHILPDGSHFTQRETAIAGVAARATGSAKCGNNRACPSSCLMQFGPQTGHVCCSL